MRTPTEIFEEVLDAWSKRVIGSMTFGHPDAAAHEARAAAYRHEFQEALAGREILGVDWGGGPSYSAGTISLGPDSRGVEVALQATPTPGRMGGKNDAA